MSESGARNPESFVRVPWVGRGEVSAIASDPQHADGVIAALGSRGVAFVRAAQKQVVSVLSTSEAWVSILMGTL